MALQLSREHSSILTDRSFQYLLRHIDCPLGRQGIRVTIIVRMDAYIYMPWHAWGMRKVCTYTAHPHPPVPLPPHPPPHPTPPPPPTTTPPTHPPGSISSHAVYPFCAGIFSFQEISLVSRIIKNNQVIRLWLHRHNPWNIPTKYLTISSLYFISLYPCRTYFVIYEYVFRSEPHYITDQRSAYRAYPIPWLQKRKR